MLEVDTPLAFLTLVKMFREGTLHCNAFQASIKDIYDCNSCQSNVYNSHNIAVKVEPRRKLTNFFLEIVNLNFNLNSIGA